MLKSDPSSQDPYQLSKTLSYVSLGMYAGFAVLEGVGLVYTIKESQALNEGDWDAQEEYEKKSLGAMGAGLACLLVGVPIGLIANSQFKKSIKLYNSSHVAGSMNDVSLNVVFIGSGVGIQVRF
ncbi:MAG: hypothetical protein HGA23_10745 [Bacteroidales bacterium]|nr:hypothetical protein [Bacteroidales bacterium]